MREASDMQRVAKEAGAGREGKGGAAPAPAGGGEPPQGSRSRRRPERGSLRRQWQGSTHPASLPAPAARVWARVRDFNGLPNWHPAIAESRIENGEPADKVGCVRDFWLRNGDRLRERLLGLSDYDMFCTYSILELPDAAQNYVATLRLTPITDGDRTFIEWSAEFDCAPEREAELVGNIGTGVFQGGFDALKRHFGG